MADETWGLKESGKRSAETPPVVRTILKKPRPMGTLQEIPADILVLEKATEGLIDEILRRGSK